MTSLNYTQSGQGSPVILIHGLFGNLDNLKTLGNALEGHQVIRIDVPNHGHSPHWPNMDYPMIAQALIDLMDELELDQAHLVGHSMGGKVAMATALLYADRVKSLVAADISPVAYQPRHQAVFEGLSNINLSSLTNRAEAQKQLLAAGIDEGTALFLLKNLAKDEQGFIWKMNLGGLKTSYHHLIGWPLSELEYTGPSLCIRGADSDYVTSTHRQAFLTQFPKIQAKTLAGTGHWLHAQKPTIFNRIVAEFIAQYD